MTVQVKEKQESGGASAPLFEPIQVGSLHLPNRIVMAPMTRCFAPNGVLGTASESYYARRAAAGVGLVISEGTWISDPAASNRDNVPRFYGEDALASWRRVLDAVHRAGGKMMPQLWHVGMVRQERDRRFNPEVLPIGPSGLALASGAAEYAVATEPMTKGRIDSVIEAFAQCARSALELGFDGIELHGAHGYLIDQFFWDRTNKRSDEYGQSVRNRARFAAEIVAACRERTSPDFPICFRFSQWKVDDYEARVVNNPDELAQLLEPLAAAGVDIFHCSTRRFWEPAFPGSELALAKWTKSITGKTTIAVGSVGLDQEFRAPKHEAKNLKVATTSLNRLLEMLEAGDFDLVAVGRALLADPDWASKVRNGAFASLLPYTPELRATLV